MAKYLLLAVLLVVFLATTGTAEMVVGFVDTDRISSEEPRFVKAQKEIDEMVAQFERDRERSEKEMQELSDRLQQAQTERRRDVMEQLGPQMSDKSQEYQAFMAETFGPGGIVETHTNEIMEPLYDRLERACEKVGKRLQIPLIFDRQTVGPLYVADTLDITDEVLAELKKLW
jgi:outer membrane protein